MQLTRSRYAGGVGLSEMRGSGSEGMYAQMILEQQGIAKKVAAEWSAERKEALQKYRRDIGALGRTSDGINQWLIHKNGFSVSQREKVEAEFNNRAEMANKLMRDLVEDYRQKMIKAGVTTGTNYVFYDLRGPAFLIYPVNTPLRNSLPRWGRQNEGFGTAVHWKYTSVSPGVVYGGAAEGKRVAAATPNENDAIATYKEFGVERSVTFTAQVAAEGYTPLNADEHLRGLQELFLQEESIILGGNEGTGTGLNGFQLGQPNQPSVAIQAAATGGGAPSSFVGTNGGTVTNAPNDTGTGFSNSTTVSVRVIELTMLGNPVNSQFGYQAAPTVGSGTGLSVSWNRTNADSTQDTIYGGMGKVSAASAVVTATTAKPFVAAWVKPKPGAFAWAWYVDVTDSGSPAAGNAVLGAITTVPYVVLGQAGAGTQTAAATGLSTDNSAQPLETTGLIGWAIKGGTFINTGDLTVTNPATGSANNGNITQGMAGLSGVPGVMEIDYDLEQQFLAMQATADCMYMDPTARRVVSACILKGASSLPSPYRFNIERDGQGNIIGAFAVSAYYSQYTMKETGSETIPIRTHTMLPPGTILYDKSQNPYPHSRLPGVRGLFVQMDYYSPEWALVSRNYPFGTYVHEALGHYIPALTTVRTGIAGSN